MPRPRIGAWLTVTEFSDIFLKINFFLKSEISPPFLSLLWFPLILSHQSFNNIYFFVLFRFSRSLSIKRPKSPNHFFFFFQYYNGFIFSFSIFPYFRLPSSTSSTSAFVYSTLFTLSYLLHKNTVLKHLEFILHWKA